VAEQREPPKSAENAKETPLLSETEGFFFALFASFAVNAFLFERLSLSPPRRETRKIPANP
jgi:hypothetical protein